MSENIPIKKRSVIDFFRQPALLLVVLPCLLLNQIFTGSCLLPAHLLQDVYPWRTGNPKDLVPWNVLQFDGITQFYPWRFFAAQTWRAGYVPLWNPHQFCGTPFLANGQSAVLYPPNVIYLLMPVKFAFGWSALFHLVLTGLAAYVFFRRAGSSSRWGAVIGAACWQLSTWQISWLALPTFLDTSTWLPVLLLTVYHLANKVTTGRAALVGAVLALMILAGHLQVAFYCVLLTTTYGIYQIAVHKIKLRQWLPVLAVTTTLALLLTAAQILPTVELSRLSTRGAGVATSSGYTAYVGLAMSADQLASLFVPGFFGHPEQGTYLSPQPLPETAGYIGVFGLLLAVVGICGTVRQRERIFFAVAAALSLLIAVGTPLNELLYYGIPGFSSTGSPARILVLWTFSMALLTSRGFDDLAAKEKWIWPASGIFALLAVVFAGGSLVEQVNQHSSYVSFVQNDLRLFAGLLLATLAIIYLFLRTTVSMAALGPLILAVLATDLIYVNTPLTSFAKPSDVYPVTPVISWLQDHAGFDRVMPLNTRWSNVEPPDAVLPPNGATVYGLYDTQGYDSLQTRRYREFTNELDGRGDIPPENGNVTFTFMPGTDAARAADGRYLVSLQPLSDFGTAVIEDGNVFVYDDVKNVGVVGSGSCSRIMPTRVDIQGNGPLNVAVQNYPGWSVFDVRGSKLGAPDNEPGLPFMRVIEAEKGPLELRFQPDSFRVGLYLTLAGLCWVAGLLGRSPGARRANTN